MVALNIATLARMYTHPMDPCFQGVDAVTHFHFVAESVAALHELNVDPRKVILYAWDIDKNQTAPFGYVFDVPTYMPLLTQIPPETRLACRAMFAERYRLTSQCITVLTCCYPVMIVMCPRSVVEWAAKHLDIAVDVFPREVYAQMSLLTRSASKPACDGSLLTISADYLLNLHTALTVPKLYPDECACDVCGCAGSPCCSNCLVARYCSSECQKADWRRHKHECRRVGMDHVVRGGSSVMVTGIHPRTIALGSIDVSIHKRGTAPAWLNRENGV